jgi:hypothetical protein
MRSLSNRCCAGAEEFRLPAARPARYDPQQRPSPFRPDPGAGGFPVKWSLMEILLLKLSLTQEDLNNVIAKNLDGSESIRDLKVRLLTEGVRVSGVYPVAFFKVRFDTLWALSVRGREVAARLADLSVAGAPAGMVRGSLLEMLSANLAQEQGARVEGESILVDPDALLARIGLVGRCNLTAVRCEAGRIVIEGGVP